MSLNLNLQLQLLHRWFVMAPVAALLTSASPALAQKFISEGPPPSDPLIEYSQQLAPRNQFFIDSDQDVEVIRFKTAHDLEICAGHGHATPDGDVRGYPVKVSWDADTAVVTPGNCLAFDARRVSVRAASPLPEDIVLQGTFRIIK